MRLMGARWCPQVPLCPDHHGKVVGNPEDKISTVLESTGHSLDLYPHLNLLSVLFPHSTYSQRILLPHVYNGFATSLLHCYL
jgi:hypothetical protein